MLCKRDIKTKLFVTKKVFDNNLVAIHKNKSDIKT